MSDYTTLVSTETLARHLADPGWAVFDVRYDLADRGAGRSRYRGGSMRPVPGGDRRTAWRGGHRPIPPPARPADAPRR